MFVVLSCRACPEAQRPGFVVPSFRPPSRNPAPLTRHSRMLLSGIQRLDVFAPQAHIKPTPPGSGSEAGATEGQSGKSQFIFLRSQRKSTIAVLHNNKKIGAKKCRRLNKPVSEYRSRILHTARTLRGRLMTHTVLIRADFYKRRFTTRPPGVTLAPS